jgi:hypothetical protein
VRWGRLLQALFMGYCMVYVFGYLYWHFWAFIFSPSVAWVIQSLVWVGLPGAFILGRCSRRN